MHGRGIVHNDVKPQNLLLDGRSHSLKLCDFGTAKRMVYGEQSRCYACSRYYRSPELILGSTCYTVAVDLWSAGCVFAELILGQPLFTGKDGIDQLVEIIKVIGTPTSRQLVAMNPNYPPDYEFTPKILAHAWEKVFKGRSDRDANDLADSLIRYDPSARLPGLQALMHRFFDSLRNDDRLMHRPLFTFLPDELMWLPKKDRDRLVPKWITAKPSR
eukprot:gnl/TRDRNA2_/TRDRNA2_161930_c1_seq1.p1 gnl/TRDRNA2_/TRDRNA2_161930_c1~~gnl/TRDRNA2_/TRDRNA2_161930_c1_seq1.p1  ORF type:complete len:216 (-),score=33.54 gnl/TRDRNA2_/TRDRNA2_161930_c1_seq1:42-689(-)